MIFVSHLVFNNHKITKIAKWQKHFIMYSDIFALLTLEIYDTYLKDE